jgi:hypothetical protein
MLTIAQLTDFAITHSLQLHMPDCAGRRNGTVMPSRTRRWRHSIPNKMTPRAACTRGICSLGSRRGRVRL